MARLSKTDVKLREIMNVAGTPDFGGLNHNSTDFRIKYMLALNWVNEMVDTPDLIKEAQSYLIAQHRADDAANVVRMSMDLQMQVGKIAYCLNRGADLAPKSLLYINNALNTVPALVAEVPETVNVFDDLSVGANGRNIQAYVDCYSRIDNLKTMVLRGKVTLEDMPDEIKRILEAFGGNKNIVRKRLLAHYETSLDEAIRDKLIKSWVKPLRVVVKTLGGNVTEIKAKAEKKIAKAAPKKGAKNAKKGAKKVAPKKSVKASNAAPKAPKAPKKAGASFSSQVRAMIEAKKPDGATPKQMIEMAMSVLNMKASSARNCVMHHWDKV